MYQYFDSVILWGDDRNKIYTTEGIISVFNSNPLFVHPIKFKNNIETVNYLMNNIFNIPT